MGIFSGAWRALKTVLTLNEKLESLQAASREQQHQIESLIARVVRLEVLIEIIEIAAPLKRDDTADPPV
jgi:hypothetical protein